MHDLTDKEATCVVGGTTSGDLAMGIAGAWTSTVAGTAVGAVVGGPIGGAIGGAVGFSIGVATMVGYSLATSQEKTEYIGFCPISDV